MWAWACVMCVRCVFSLLLLWALTISRRVYFLFTNLTMSQTECVFVFTKHRAVSLLVGLTICLGCLVAIKFVSLSWMCLATHNLHPINSTLVGEHDIDAAFVVHSVCVCLLFANTNEFNSLRSTVWSNATISPWLGTRWISNECTRSFSTRCDTNANWRNMCSE